ncbi:Rha family transcriptional regulator [Halomonas daqiaonensis]|uniref:Phage regulatory protein Rha (Phage_pRha) n=1 Tax=Halomonas daqiaonensis TaxID=650850 RepID=A0A1H7QAW5_9GAMM|nr:Rha family transcriptional regulator [Halomonas daqiaonensis]SEL45301.1 Phage regulatory protein Rha (Phage_pRha) [Halomonas daqiaonensis]
MTNVLTTTNALTMSSREIAELVESRHDKVKQSMERLAERGLITFTPVGEKSTGGRPAVAYHVNQRDSYVIVAQLCPEFTARMVDRWQELEEKVAKPKEIIVSNEYLSALKALVALEEEKQRLARERRSTMS